MEELRDQQDVRRDEGGVSAAAAAKAEMLVTTDLLNFAGEVFDKFRENRELDEAGEFIASEDERIQSAEDLYIAGLFACKAGADSTYARLGWGFIPEERRTELEEEGVSEQWRKVTQAFRAYQERQVAALLDEPAEPEFEETSFDEFTTETIDEEFEFGFETQFIKYKELGAAALSSIVEMGEEYVTGASEAAGPSLDEMRRIGTAFLNRSREEVKSAIDDLIDPTDESESEKPTFESGDTGQESTTAVSSLLDNLSKYGEMARPYAPLATSLLAGTHPQLAAAIKLADLASQAAAKKTAEAEKPKDDRQAVGGAKLFVDPKTGEVSTSFEAADFSDLAQLGIKGLTKLVKDRLAKSEDKTPKDQPEA